MDIPVRRGLTDRNVDLGLTDRNVCPTGELRPTAQGGNVECGASIQVDRPAGCVGYSMAWGSFVGYVPGGPR
jgi:hypothetical protein